MAQSIVGLENVQPYKFSECSRADYVDALRVGHGLCLMNKPNEVKNLLKLLWLFADKFKIPEKKLINKPSTINQIN